MTDDELQLPLLERIIPVHTVIMSMHLMNRRRACRQQ